MLHSGRPFISRSEDHRAESQPDGYLRVPIDRRSGSTIALVGDIDLVSIGTLDVVIRGALLDKPTHLVFDARACDFISIKGFNMIGRCSRVVEKVTLCTKLKFAQQALGLLGFDDVECVVTTVMGTGKVELLPQASDGGKVATNERAYRTWNRQTV